MKKIKDIVKKTTKKILLTVPFIKSRIKYYDSIVQQNNILIQQNKHLRQIINNCGFEPGHYYSPIPNLSEINKEEAHIFIDKNLAEINLNTENQVKLLNELKVYYSDYPYKGKDSNMLNYRYKKEGAFYRFSDSVFLFCMMRHFKPQRIIEIGSGHSSAIMLDTNEHFFDNKIHCTFIEPFPEERLMQILRESDKLSHQIIKEKVQSVKLEVFQMLNKNDILFIDSTHVSKIGSDVNHLLFEVLPSLKPGVLVHFHDIFYPFELPKHWVLESRYFWNENYILRAFLMNNEKYEIIIFNTYLQKIKPDWFKKEMPECTEKSEGTGSIWLRKL